jgi:cytochrome P450
MARHTKFVGNPLFRMSQSNPSLFKHLPVAGKFLKDVRENIGQLMQFFNRQVEEHLKTIDFESDLPPTDFTEAYLKEKKRQGNDDPRYSRYNMLNVVFDLWLAGMETTATTLSWALIYLIHNPECQEKMYRELNNKIGSDRLILMSDRSELPYTCAVINEILRLANLLPLNLPHRTIRDVVVNGFEIPKNTIIIPMISTVLYDEEVYPEAHSFKPERFLDKNGQLKSYDEFVPFSIGKRQCLGEGLARYEMFLFTANLFNNFKVGHPFVAV